MARDDDHSDSGSDTSDEPFASVDFSGVNFDGDDENNVTELQQFEKGLAFGATTATNGQQTVVSEASLCHLGTLLAEGKYIEILRDSDVAKDLFGSLPQTGDDVETNNNSIQHQIRQQVLQKGSESLVACIQLEIVGIAALNLFLQCNYTGPFVDDNELAGVNPHDCFAKLRRETTTNSEQQVNNTPAHSRGGTSYQTAILSELAVDGYWPCQVSYHPYFLLVARSILSTLANGSSSSLKGKLVPPRAFVAHASQLQAIALWSARACVAHERLLEPREPSLSLWNETQQLFEQCQNMLENNDSNKQEAAATVMLEWGLAEHHFDRPGKGKQKFEKAKVLSGLEMEVTGAIGKRTKFQRKATAQMVVRAKSADPTAEASSQTKTPSDPTVKDQMIEHGEDGILLEKIRFEEDKENEVHRLDVLDQSILLALCLDVKNSNANDGLTGEEMGAFLARVLDHHDDWMVYSTSLLERAWLEFERSHARERAILQMQALADQHTNRLTITQSTKQSIEESAPVQQRLLHLHSIVYPPRWLTIQDLADRYAALGIVTSAAELFTEIEQWDDVVECYRRAGRVSQAETIVRERLAKDETPRMWAALGDLTKDPVHYEKAIELSNGRYADAYLALAEYHFGKGDLVPAAENFDKALKVRPLIPSAWFRLGTVSMQLKRWQEALRAFSEVVMQEPEEADAWANIAAIHMHNKQPSEAYPALNESLKQSRSNWRVWVSKLYTCLDLEKFDEAIQACNEILDLRSAKKAADGVPFLEEKCLRALVGGSFRRFHESRGDEIALDSTRRTLSRVHALLDRISSSADYSDGQEWVLEIQTFFYEQTGQDSEVVLEALMKEYRSLQAIANWEKENHLVRKHCQVVSHMAHIYRNQGKKEGLVKSRFLLRGIVEKVKASRPEEIPDEVVRLEGLQEDIETQLQSLN